MIHRAVQTGNIGFLNVFLEAGVSANTVGNCHRTPLHFVTVTKGDYEFMAMALLKAKANPDATDHHGNTPLHMAADRGTVSMVKLLLKNGATATITNNQLYTPIHNAAANGHTNAAKQMLEQEKAINPKFEILNLPHRIHQVAERHGQHDTAAAIQALPHSTHEF